MIILDEQIKSRPCPSYTPKWWAGLEIGKKIMSHLLSGGGVWVKVAILKLPRKFYNPGQKYMVHLEKLLSFHYRPLIDDKAALFPKLGPPPHTMLLQGGHFKCTDPTLYGGRGEGTVKLSKKDKCTITFDQDCSRKSYYDGHICNRIGHSFKPRWVGCSWASFTPHIAYSTPLLSILVTTSCVVPDSKGWNLTIK